MLAFKKEEMINFMEEVGLKKKLDKYDKMFGFNGKSEIKQTRGHKEERNMTKYLIENRIEGIMECFD